MIKNTRILKVLEKGKRPESWICIDNDPQDEDDKTKKFELFFSPANLKVGDIVQAKHIHFNLLNSQDFIASMQRGSDFSTKPYKYLKKLKLS